MDNSYYDKIIIGAGLYGLYSALYAGKRSQKVLVIEMDDAPFKRATYINQARVHMGYHYPRSLNTAIRSACYFKRFNEDFGFSVFKSFEQIYATSSQFSWTDASEFRYFCRAAGIRCEDVPVEKYFKPDMCDGAFLTEEYTYDAHVLRDYFIDEIAKFPNIEIRYGALIESIEYEEDRISISLSDGTKAHSGFVLNATYASVNDILKRARIDDLFSIKYELCEIILCEVTSKLKDVGITVMDGPFFSVMPFGLTGMHSLTSVTFTPHDVSHENYPSFGCQNERNGCNPFMLRNCNDCPNHPKSSWPYMSRLAGKYLNDELGISYRSSLFSMKPILKSSEVDDSRPTCIKVHSTNPTFISVLSGKINTVYDLDSYLN